MKNSFLLMASIFLCGPAIAQTGAATPAVAAPTADAATADELEAQLDQLRLPANTLPAGLTSESVYAVQSRYSPLSRRHEVGFGFGHNLTGNGFFTMQQFEMSYRYHLNDRWSLGAAGAYGLNRLTSSGQRLLDDTGLLPDAAYVKYRGDVSATFNTFYGKLRFSPESVVYFDQYISFGPALIQTDLASAIGGALDIGFSVWMGRWGSVRFGAKGNFYNEKRRLSQAFTQHWVGHIDLSFLMGGDGGIDVR